MKTALALVLTCCALASCDSVFIRRVELIPDRGAGGTFVPPDPSRVKAAVRAFALEAGLECSEGSTALIIECHRQPVSVLAVQTKNSIAVCFGAMGVPFENRKFTAQMDRMQSQLMKEFGQDAVRVLQDPCPSARSQQSLPSQ